MIGPLLVLMAGLLGSLVVLLLHWRVPASPFLQWLCLLFLIMSVGGMVLAGLRLRSQLLLDRLGNRQQGRIFLAGLGTCQHP